MDLARQHLWSEAFAHLGLPIAQLTLDGRVLTANRRLCEIIGCSPQELEGREFREIFDSRDGDVEFPLFLNRLISGEVEDDSTEMSARKCDGELVWFHMTFTLVREDRRPQSLTAVATDITSLRQASEDLRNSEAARHELSRRMMNAQEADRTRIARELHDDIGQSLAILKIQMLRSGQPVSGDPVKKHADPKELARRLDEIIHKVSRLSHDLHSSELEFIGLAAALKNHCRQHSEQLRIPVHCHCDEVEKTLSSITALAFLRVVQEALHNAAKHSQAQSVVVRLSGSNQYLSLEICDDGVGFDIEATRLAAGLGLLSMRERIHLIGGEFDIYSRPGRGTRIMARVPVGGDRRASFTI
jgi:PAS domain S-box-containing protein